jgi:hypothetical protein
LQNLFWKYNGASKTFIVTDKVVNHQL